MVRSERFESVMKEHYHQEGITFSYPPMCKFRDGLQLLKKLIDAQLMTDDPRLVTHKLWSLMCFLPEWKIYIRNHTLSVMSWYCLGTNFPLKGVDYMYLGGDYGKGKLMNQKIVWLPFWDKELGFQRFKASLLGSPQRHNQLEGPKNETQTERKPSKKKTSQTMTQTQRKP